MERLEVLLLLMMLQCHVIKQYCGTTNRLKKEDARLPEFPIRRICCRSPTQKHNKVL